ncbi:MAG: shikimate kinase [Bacteroidales bacterium]|nr:shikimate kinase [Bacteroidales bacterium]
MTVALTGFMMCGKTSYGRDVAERLGWEFIDLDDCIEPGTPAGEIIRSRGEETFRQLETEALKQVLQRSGNCILALGGGTPMQEENRALLRESCRVIWLKASLEESVFNPEWAHMTASRPLLAGGDRTRIEALWQSRLPVYESIADTTIVTDGKSAEEVISEIAEAVRP